MAATPSPGGWPRCVGSTHNFENDRLPRSQYLCVGGCHAWAPIRTTSENLHAPTGKDARIASGSGGAPVTPRAAYVLEGGRLFDPGHRNSVLISPWTCGSPSRDRSSQGGRSSGRDADASATSRRPRAGMTVRGRGMRRRVGGPQGRQTLPGLQPRRLRVVVKMTIQVSAERFRRAPPRTSKCVAPASRTDADCHPG